MGRVVPTPVPRGTRLWDLVMGSGEKKAASEERAQIDWLVPPRDAYQNSEHQLQVSLLTVLRMEAGTYPELLEIFAVPNGGHRNPIVGKKLKAEGVQPGIPDLFLDVPRGGWHGLRLELKVGANRPSEAQWARLELLHSRGYRALVANDLEVARQLVTGYLREEVRRC